MANKENLELEPPRKSDVEKIAELDPDIESHDNTLDTITEIIKKRVSELEERESGESDELTVREQRDRLSREVFSHDSEGSSNDEDLSEIDNIDAIQQRLADKVFSHD